MGYGVHAYAVDLGRVRAVVGSGDSALIEQIGEKHRRSLDEADRIDASEPSARDAVVQLVANRMSDGEVNFKYGYALELVCRELGEPLSNLHWSAMHGEWFDAVDDAFNDLGGTAKLTSEVFWSGPPVDLPFIDDFPVIGTIESERVAGLASEIQTSLTRASASDETSAIREILTWLRRAERDGAGLVTFYY